MKKQLLTLISAVSVSLALGQTIPNGGFENWTISNYAVPQNYGTSSFSQISHNGNLIAPYNAVQTTDFYHGSYAIQLTTASVVCLAKSLINHPIKL